MLTKQHENKVLSHFEDEFGVKLESLYMCDSFTIVFTDESKIKMVQDWRGHNCYFSQEK
jgi:hypothetical protein